MGTLVSENIYYIQTTKLNTFLVSKKLNTFPQETPSCSAQSPLKRVYARARTPMCV
jgi:hypothetical protein